MRFITLSPTYSISIRRSCRLVDHSDLDYSMEKNSYHSSHDEDEALRVPPKQVHELSIGTDKMHDWLLQENHNTDTMATFDALKKVTYNDGNGSFA